MDLEVFRFVCLGGGTECVDLGIVIMKCYYNDNAATTKLEGKPTCFISDVNLRE